jgi:hypothetical protein
MAVAFVWDLRRKPLGHKVLEFFPRHYSRNQKDAAGNLATRISVVEDHYFFALPLKTVMASQKLEERGTWENGSFVGFKGAKREATYTYTGTRDLYRFFGSDQPVHGSPDETKNRLRFSGGFGAGPTMEIGELNRKRSLVYRSDNLLGFTYFTMELIEKTSVKVPAGIFPDCIHLRFGIGIDSGGDVAEEWWAKGVGLVKWKGISGKSKGISETLVSADIKKIIPYSPPGISISGRNVTQRYPTNENEYRLLFPLVSIPGVPLEEKITIRNTGSEPLKGLSIRLRREHNYKMDPFETQDLRGGKSVVVTIRLTIPEGKPAGNDYVDIECENTRIDPKSVLMNRHRF